MMDAPFVVFSTIVRGGRLIFRAKPIRSQTIRTVVFPLWMPILLCDRFFSGRSSEMTSSRVVSLSWTPNRSAFSCHLSSSGRRNSRGSPASDRFETRNNPCIPRQGMALFSSVAVALQAVLAANPNAVRLLMCTPCQPLQLLLSIASMEHLCAGSSLNERISGAYVLWKVRGYLISRIFLTFQVNADKTTTCQVLLI
ncbi:hypothetical protein EV401DRAFT_2027777 [Pisolithus croceorrhizus]|nr:hypothetical protein EV401DRAFT_2027777 [Pisolithus croceorrhizus]